jgi:hypothetical protein
MIRGQTALEMANDATTGQTVAAVNSSLSEINSGKLQIVWRWSSPIMIKQKLNCPISF